MVLWTFKGRIITSDWLWTVHISGLWKTIDIACSRVFAEDIYGDHVVSCARIICIKHRHNVVRYTLVDICYRSGISAGKEVDIGSSHLCSQRMVISYGSSQAVAVYIAGRDPEEDSHDSGLLGLGAAALII
ncbi:hypothetical protein Tco_1213739 [Tanacetum coccineum]